jgi:hypothetical protein
MKKCSADNRSPCFRVGGFKITRGKCVEIGQESAVKAVYLHSSETRVMLEFIQRHERVTTPASGDFRLFFFSLPIPIFNDNAFRSLSARTVEALNLAQRLSFSSRRSQPHT